MKDLKPGWAAAAEASSEEFLERFLAELEAAHDMFDWQLSPDAGAEPEPRQRARYRLRGISKRGPASGAMFEPVGAVCYARTGAVYTEDNWSGAARALGLPSLCMADLIAAANDHTWAGPGGRRQPVHHLRALRTRLIRAVGLRPETHSRQAGDADL